MAVTKKWDDRIDWRGFTFTRAMVEQLKWVEEMSGLSLVIGQGSFHKGVAASAGSHDEEAVDLSVRQYTEDEKKTLDYWMKRAGFAGWLRRAITGLWPEHYHAVPLGRGRLLSPLARIQTVDFDKRLDGLASHRPDPSWRPKVKRRWSYRLGRPIPRV